MREATRVQAAIQHFRPRLKNKLGSSWKFAMRSRQEEKPVKARFLFGSRFCTRRNPGVRSVAQSHCFSGGLRQFLRRAEMAFIQKRYVVSRQKNAILRVRHGKTIGSKLQDAELAVVTRPLSLQMLKRVLPKLQKHDKRCGCSTGALRSHMTRTVNTLGLSHLD